MLTRKTVIHIGMAKCASTSIQAALSACEDIHYVGFNPVAEEGVFWSGERIGQIFDRIMRFECLDSSFVRDVLTDEYERASLMNKPLVISSESLAIRFLPWDLPTHTKLKFLKEVIPGDVEFLYVYKHPIDLLLSLYKEWVLLGYSGGFQQFCGEQFRYRDISFFKDLCLGRFLEVFFSIFDNSTLNVVFLEDGNLYSKLSDIVGKEIRDAGNRFNESLSDVEIEIIRDINCKSNDIGPFFDVLEKHRCFPYLEESEKYALARKKRYRKAVAVELAIYCDGQHKENNLIDEDIKKFFLNDLKRAKQALSKSDRSVNIIEQYMERIYEN